MTRARDVSNLLGTGTTTVKVSNIQNPSSSVANLSLASDGTVSGGIPSPNRNILYNGAMQVAQRGTSTASITSNGYYTADRWFSGITSLGTWTQSVENDAPTGSGLRKSLKMLVTTADASPAAADRVNVEQALEGQDLQRLAKGTSSAQQLTLSFWVKSNVTGTYTAYLYDNDNTRQVSAAYVISASATWERKTITFPADATGAFDNDNNASLYVSFGLAAGSDFTSGTLGTTWAAAVSANRMVGQTNLAAATNNYWQITGVQLEVGPVASAFEFKPYGQELRECQRYYQRWTGGSIYSLYGYGTGAASTDVKVALYLKASMRVEPTAIESSNVAASDIVNTPLTTTAVAINNNVSGPDVVHLDLTVTGATVYRPYALVNNNNTAGYVALSAEL